MTTDTRRLEPHELKDAMRPGLFPDLDNAPDTVAEWDGLDDLREQHQHALDRYQRGLAQLSREQAESPTQLNVNERREAEAAVRREAVTEVSRIVWEARDLVDDWRAVEDATEHERKMELEELRKRLAQLETEDLLRKRLAVWLKRLRPNDDAHITPGIHPWALMAETPEPYVRPMGPIARSFQPQEHEEDAE